MPRSKVISVILCCAEEDIEALRPVERTLRDEALDAHILGGVELDAAALARHMAKPRDAGVYVLCRSEGLDAFQVPKLEATFQEHKHINDRLLEFDFDGERAASDLLPRIRAAASRLAGGSDGGATLMFDGSRVADDRGASPLRWVIPVALVLAGVGWWSVHAGWWSSDASTDDEVVASAAGDDGSAQPVLAAGSKAAAEEQAESEEPVVEAAPVEDATAPTEAAAITAAIEAGKIRSLNDLLVARVPSKPMTWADAGKACALDFVGGVKRWRLPTISELERLRRARLLRQGVYWSTNRPGSDPDVALVLDVDVPKPRPLHKTEPSAAAQCVRRR